MNELELLPQLSARDVRITLTPDGAVDFDAPAAVWTPALVDWLRTCKPALVRQLQALQRGVCPGCGEVLSLQHRNPPTHWCAGCRLWVVNGVPALAPASPLLSKRASQLVELPEPPSEATAETPSTETVRQPLTPFSLSSDARAAIDRAAAELARRLAAGLCPDCGGGLDLQQPKPRVDWCARCQRRWETMEYAELRDWLDQRQPQKARQAAA